MMTLSLVVVCNLIGCVYDSIHSHSRPFTSLYTGDHQVWHGRDRVDVGWYVVFDCSTVL
jgi:hypothetical protein